MTEMMEIPDKNVKIAIINMFHMLKKVEENISRQKEEKEGIEGHK